MDTNAALSGNSRAHVGSNVVSKQQQHMLRSIYEILEADGKLVEVPPNRPPASVTASSVAQHRAWSNMMTRRVALQLEQVGLLTFRPDEHVQLTPRGLVIARRIVREHRLLERYFIRQTDVSEGDADRGADYLEHSCHPSCCGN